MLTNIKIDFDIETADGKQPVIQWDFLHYRHKQTLWTNSSAEFELDLENGDHCISFDFINKTNQDTTDQEDLAVIIKDIKINGISDEKIFNHAIYRPQYPDPWFSQQSQQPNSKLYGHRYLGWNGNWKLDFSVPSFKWLHQTMGFGWHY